eukprot:m.243721 g.243721  ORF g.243721 m.243721 type:complete len:381 (+) comp19460_c0_seq2:645-1787(+)
MAVDHSSSAVCLCPMDCNEPLEGHVLQPTCVEQPAVVLVQLFAVGYYHFLLEVLPRLLIALGYIPSATTEWAAHARENSSESTDTYGLGIRDNAVVVVPTDGTHMHRFMSDLLDIVGITSDRIVPYSILQDRQAARTCRLTLQHAVYVDWVPRADNTDSLPTPGGAHVQGTPPSDPAATHLPAPYALHVVRHALRPALASEDAGSGPSVVAVWVQRRAAPTRRVVGEDGVIARLQASIPRHLRSTVELHVFSDSPRSPPVADALALFSRASVVLGMHGAGLANAVVCAPNTTLIELALPEPHATYYAHLARANGLRYHAVPLRPDPNNTSGGRAHPGGTTTRALYASRDVIVPVPALVAAWREALRFADRWGPRPSGATP